MYSISLIILSKSPTTILEEIMPFQVLKNKIFSCISIITKQYKLLNLFELIFLHWNKNCEYSTHNP